MANSSLPAGSCRRVGQGSRTVSSLHDVHSLPASAATSSVTALVTAASQPNPPPPSPQLACMTRTALDRRSSSSCRSTAVRSFSTVYSCALVAKGATLACGRSTEGAAVQLGPHCLDAAASRQCLWHPMQLRPAEAVASNAAKGPPSQTAPLQGSESAAGAAQPACRLAAPGPRQLPLPDRHLHLLRACCRSGHVQQQAVAGHAPSLPPPMVRLPARRGRLPGAAAWLAAVAGAASWTWLPSCRRASKASSVERQRQWRWRRRQWSGRLSHGHRHS